MQVLTPEMKRQMLRDKGVVISVDSRVEMNFDSIAKQMRTRSHKSSRKANKLVRKDTSHLDVGKFFLVKTNMGLAPYNTRSGTEYILPANTECIAVQMKGWLALYLTKGMLFDSIEDVMLRCKHIRAKDTFDPSRGKYPEFRVIGFPTFRDSTKVAFKKMLPENWVADVDSYVPRIKEVYNM